MAPSPSLIPALPLTTLPPVPVHWGWSTEDPVVRLVSMLKRLIKAYSITVTLPLFVASVAHDRRTALADGYPSLIPSLPHSTTVEQPAAPFYPTPHSLPEDGIKETGTRRLEIDLHAHVLRARLELPVPVLSDLLGPTPQSSDDTRIGTIICADPKHACVDPNQKSCLAWIQTKKLSCVDPNQKSCLVWIQTKKLACVDPHLTCVDPNPKLSLCGSKTKSVTCVDPKKKK